MRADLIGPGARRVALAATAIVAAAYLLIAVAVVLIVTHNLTSTIDSTLTQSLESMAAQRPSQGGPFSGPKGRQSVRGAGAVVDVPSGRQFRRQ
jgi:hypothetical protein